MTIVKETTGKIMIQVLESTIRVQSMSLATQMNSSET